jgi:hypothetical protein
VSRDDERYLFCRESKVPNNGSKNAFSIRRFDLTSFFISLTTDWIFRTNIYNSLILLFELLGAFIISLKFGADCTGLEGFLPIVGQIMFFNE